MNEIVVGAPDRLPLPPESYETRFQGNDAALYQRLLVQLHSDNEVLTGLRTIQAINLERVAYSYVALRRAEHAPIVPFSERKHYSSELMDWNNSLYAWTKSLDNDIDVKTRFARAVALSLGRALEENTGRGKVIKSEASLRRLKEIAQDAVMEALG